MKSSVFWDLTPCVPLKQAEQTACGKCRIIYTRENFACAVCIMLFSGFAYSSALKVGAKCSSEVSVYFKKSTQRYILEDIYSYPPV
jgi:hypothetical protein